MGNAFHLPFDQPFDIVAALARADGVLLAPDYYRLPAEKRAQAFTVSGLARLDQVQAVADQLAKFQASGSTFAEFKKWAKTQNWNLPAHRLDTIYRNAVQTAYMAGHWRSFEEGAESHPYLMYDAINDSRTRPAHLALDGVIKPVGDPFWKTHSPPLGHRCRCSIRALRRDEARERGGVTQNVPVEGGADPGWGADPRQWSQTLERIVNERQSACRVDSASFGRKQRPVTQNVDCTPWGAKMLEMIKNPQSAMIVEFANRAISVADRQMLEQIGEVSNAPALLIQTGFNLDGYVRSIDNYAVRHIIKQHGNPAREAMRGQIAVTLADLGLIPAITSSPDQVFYGGKNKVKRDVLIYLKLIDGVGYWYVEELRTGRVQAAADSLRKKKGAWSAS